MSFHLPEAPADLMSSPSSFISVDESGATFVAFQVQLEDFGLGGVQGVTVYQLVRRFFLKTFSELEGAGAPAEVLVSARSFKRSHHLIDARHFQYFSRDGISVFFFYEPRASMYRVFLIDKRYPDTAVKVDVKDISEPAFFEFVSSINPY